MRPDRIIERHVACDPILRLPDGLVRMQIDLLVFDASPESFHEHVVAPTAFAVHADLNAVVLEQPREGLACELAALVGVEDLRATMLRDRRLHRFEAEVRRQRIGQPPGQDPTSGPVQNRKQVDEAPTHRNIGVE